MRSRLLKIAMSVIALSLTGLLVWLLYYRKSERAIFEPIPTVPISALGHLSRLAKVVRSADALARKTPLSAERVGTLGMLYHANDGRDRLKDQEAADILAHLASQTL